MTPQAILDIALRRAGLSYSNSTYRENAIEYANITMSEILAHPWTFRNKQGTFNTTSGTAEYNLATDVAHVRHFKDTTNDNPIKIVTESYIDELDIDRSETGDPRFVFFSGLDESSAGETQVTFYPKPDSTATVTYEYVAEVPDFAESNLTTNYDIYTPIWFQAAVMYGISALYHSEKGDPQGASVENDYKNNSIQTGLMYNRTISSDRKFRLGRRDSRAGQFSFVVQEGSLQVAS